MEKIVIGLGNTGTVIVRELAKKNINNVKLFAIDSQVKHVSIDNVSKVKYIPIVADDNVGSGRDRDRGRAMFEYNLEEHNMDELFDMCQKTDTIFVVSSAAGGTGSGSCPKLCEALFDRLNEDVKIIPIIVCPNMKDPDAYHYNTNDLMIDLKNVQIGPYVIFRNPDSSDYEKINAEIVSAIDVLLGNRYEITDNDEIDASDLNNVLSVNGRIIALSISADSVDEARKKLMKEIVSSYQPAWDPSQIGYGVAAFSMKSINAGEDSKLIEDDIRSKLEHCSDIYKNIVINDNNGKVDITLIVAGLPPVEMKTIETDYTETVGIADNLSKMERPKVMKRKHISFKDFKKNSEKPVNSESSESSSEK